MAWGARSSAWYNLAKTVTWRPRPLHRSLRCFGLAVCLLAPIGWLQSAESPDHVVATVNGKKLTVREVERIFLGLPPQAQQQFRANREEFLRQYALIVHLADLAESAGLDKQSPYAQQLAWQKMQVLMQAAISERAASDKGSQPAGEVPPGLKQWLDELRSQTQVTFEDQTYLSLPPEKLAETPASKIIARINGEPLTAGEIHDALTGAGPQIRQNFLEHRQEFLSQYALMKRLAGIALDHKLDQLSPYREQLAWVRANVLAQAFLNHESSAIQVTSEDARAYYEAHKNDFVAARVKVLYLPFDPYGKGATTSAGKKIPPEAEARRLAQDLAQRARSGADFVELVRQYSQDEKSARQNGDFGTIRKTSRLPEEIKQAIFSLKPGQVSDPVRQPNGYYLFRLEELSPIPFQEVEEELIRELREKKFQAWFDSIRQAVQVVIEDPAYFRQPSSG